MLAMMECVGLSIGEVYSIAHIHTLYRPLGVLFVLPCVTQFWPKPQFHMSTVSFLSMRFRDLAC